MEEKLKDGQIPSTFAEILSGIPICDLTTAEKHMAKILVSSGYLVHGESTDGAEYLIKKHKKVKGKDES